MGMASQASTSSERSRGGTPLTSSKRTSSRTRYALRPSDSNRNKISFKNVRNPMNLNEKAFSNRNSKSLFPIHSPLRLDWPGSDEPASQRQIQERRKELQPLSQ
jgi:hypothetical protein